MWGRIHGFEAVGDVRLAERGIVSRGADPKHADRWKEMQEQDTMGPVKADRAKEADEPSGPSVFYSIKSGGVVPSHAERTDVSDQSLAP